MAQKQALCRMGDERFRAGGALVERVEVQGHEGVGLGVVGFAADGVQVILLSKQDGDAISFQISFHVLGQLIGQVALAQSHGFVDCAGIKEPVVAGVEINFHRCISS